MRLSLKAKIFTVFAAVTGVTAVGFAGFNAVAQKSATQQDKLAPLPQQPNGVPFPTQDWQVANTADSAKIDALAKVGLAGTDPDLGQTRALVVIKGGKIIYEKYSKGFDKDSKLISWSIGKSIFSGIMGVALEQKKVSLDEPINDPHFKAGDKRRAITYRQALTMTDGLAWREEDAKNIINNDAAIMLYGKGKENTVAYVTEKKSKHDAGTYWNYSTGATNLAAAGLSRKISKRTVNDPYGKAKFRTYIYNEFFHKIGMNQTAAEFDASGNLQAGSFFYATARDYAKFALLFLREGVWEGQRILPQGYVDMVRTPVNAENAQNYGMQWWLNRQQKHQFLPKSPTDTFLARGNEGQIIAIVPSKDLIVLRLGLSNSEKGWDSVHKNIDDIIAAVD